MREGLVFILIFLIVGMTFPSKEVQSQETFQTIPDDAIRLRILANSDDEADQRIKHVVRDNVNQYIERLVAELDDIEVARQVIQDHLPGMEEIIADTLEQEKQTEDFTIEYGSKVSFPTKVYDHYVYPAGEYEAVLITLGEGKGANWWCVLFPPLCFLDFSNGATVEDPDSEEVDTDHEPVTKVDETEDDEEVEFSFFLFEWLGLS